MESNSQIRVLKGVGEKTAALFEKIGIGNIEDLLRHYPLAYDTFSAAVAMDRLQAGVLCAVRGRLSGGIAMRRVRSLTISVCRVSDGTETVSLTFFNMPYLKNRIKPGEDYIFRGVAQGGPGKWKMEQPAVCTPSAYEELLDTLQPRYSLTKGLTNHMVTKAMRQALSLCSGPGEYLPEDIRACYDLMEYREALEGIHFPAHRDMLQKARNRLVFDEFFLFILRLRWCREHEQAAENRWPMADRPESERLIRELPYPLTGAQRRVWDEIKADLAGKTVMNRLIQGDVGCGKTILAVLALLQTVACGWQGALMAPTEVLARQHFESLCELTKAHDLPFVPLLLTGSMSARGKKECYRQIESGEANVVICTHALIQEKAVYRNLALVVTDEQHRFGVRQREALAGKGTDTHVLVMSSTPIPRTLALILYGDLHISLVDEMPARRLPIKNCVVDISYREKAYRFIGKEIENGRQAYIICPMVEEGEMEGLENVVAYSEKLKGIFPAQVRIAALHGRMKAAEKNRIMEAFGRGEIDILVSTTVVEVGINVPNASVMMVENAERFGLAQLHQLRGRVGRGSEQSYCIFVSTSGQTHTMERLSVLRRSNDGFLIAEEDLRLRGPGDMFGIRQSGSLEFRLADIYQDAKILRQADRAVEDLLRKKGGMTGDLGLSLPYMVDFAGI